VGCKADSSPRHKPRPWARRLLGPRASHVNHSSDRAARQQMGMRGGSSTLTAVSFAARPPCPNPGACATGCSTDRCCAAVARRRHLPPADLPLSVASRPMQSAPGRRCLRASARYAPAAIGDATFRQIVPRPPRHRLSGQPRQHGSPASGSRGPDAIATGPRNR